MCLSRGTTQKKRRKRAKREDVVRVIRLLASRVRIRESLLLRVSLEVRVEKR